MKRNVIVFGLIAGLIVTAMMLFSISKCYRDANFEGSMLVGYASMVLAFSFIFVGVKNYRDKYNNEIISFGKGFRIGLYISLIASTIYVLVWLIDYYVFIPDFMEKYTAHVLSAAQKSGASAAEMSAKVAEMEDYRQMYKNPLFVILLTYMEILPVGIVISIIAALILKRKSNHQDSLATQNL
jgi:uncharacterized membrane protein